MLYRTHRPHTFADVVGQEHVIRTLKGALTSGRIAHAYLFTGPRGTGKTTLARIFAKAVMCQNRGASGEPDNACPHCIAVDNGSSLDLIEIDGASHGRVDEIRALKESASVAASSANKKIFLIDEVHMVTTGAFNALLKVLEEPPSHVMFLFATTDPQKIPATVLSRVQRYDLRRLTITEISDKLLRIAKEEKMPLKPDAAHVIAAAADGALRDAEVLLSKMHGMNVPALDVATVTDVLGLVPHALHPEFFGYLVANDRANALAFLARITEAGINLDIFARDFLEYARAAMIAHANPALLAGVSGVHDHATLTAHGQACTPEHHIRIIMAFTDARARMRTASLPQLPLELAVLELMLPVQG
ncbi:MAG: DNA polymerase III subunit gamma/tau [Patescibacteria group bacterium]